MAILGLGTDIVEIARIAGIIHRSGDRLAKRLLHESEWQQYQQQAHPARWLAKRFAAKEAAAKALGCGIRHGLAFNQLVVTHNAQGKPELSFHKMAKQIADRIGVVSTHISLTDERHYACATVILEQ